MDAVGCDISSDVTKTIFGRSRLPRKGLKAPQDKDRGQQHSISLLFSVSIIKGVSHFADVLIIIIIISRVLQAL